MKKAKIIRKDIERTYLIPNHHMDSSYHTRYVSNPVVCSNCNYDFKNDLFSKHEIDLLKKMKRCYNCGCEFEHEDSFRGR